MAAKTYVRTLGRHIRKWHRSRQEKWFQPHTIINGRYRILRALGMGSYGVTYLCEDMHTSGNCVLKRIYPVGGGSTAKKIYTNETNVLSQLSNSVIPTLYDCFRYEFQLCYTMEFIEGKSLDELIFQQHCTYSEKESLILLRSLLQTVTYIHSKDIIHRDISIANVLVQGDCVSLIDFGLARQLGTAVAEADDVYMSYPSDTKLKRTVHVTSDFYAIGHLLLYLLYSTYKEQECSESQERSWQEELCLQPGTKKLLRRLLMTERPYGDSGEIIRDIDLLLETVNHCSAVGET